MRAKPARPIILKLPLLPLPALLLAICACLAPAPRPARAQTPLRDDPDAGSLRVIFGWANSRNNNHATKIIAGFAAAKTIDDSGRHEINAEWLLSSWQTSFYDAGGNFVCRRSELHAPLLLNYRYYIALPRVPCAFYAGGGIGCDFISTSYMLDVMKADGSLSSSSWGGWSFSLAAAANAGFAVRLSRYFCLDISYRCLWQSASGYWPGSSTDDNGFPYSSTQPKVYIGTRPDIVNMILFNIRFSF